MTAKDNDSSPPTAKSATSSDVPAQAPASKPKPAPKATSKKVSPDASAPAPKKTPTRKTASPDTSTKEDTLVAEKTAIELTKTIEPARAKTSTARAKSKPEQPPAKTDTRNTAKLDKEKPNGENAEPNKTKAPLKIPPATSTAKKNGDTLNETNSVGATKAANVAMAQTTESPSILISHAAHIVPAQEANISTSETPPVQHKAANKVRHRNPKPELSLTEKIKKQLPLYARLMRLDKPIGILLLLWPTLWSLWLAAKGIPRWDLLIIFVLGVVVMRSAGCVINDFADRKIDGKVKRTQDRPLATGAVSGREAIILFAVLCAVAFGLVLFTNLLTIQLSVGGLILAASYPYMKRHTHLPQVVLGAAFAWGIPMAFTAQAGVLTKGMWLIYLAVVLWTVAYDTFYAMVDRDDDLKIGVKSTAILFGEQDRIITGAIQAMTIYALVLVGQHFELEKIYYASLIVAAALFSYQQVLIRYREREACFKAFLNNNWVGAVVFVGIAGDLALK